MGLISWLRGGRSADAPAAPAPDGARQGRVDVSRLAPVQRSVTGQDLLINPRGFEAGLTTRQDTSLGTPMGHLVSPEAPAGLVRGVVDAAPGNPPPPLQRSVEMPIPARRATHPAAVQRVYGDGLPSLTSAGPATASAGLPVRQLVGEQPLVPPGDGHAEAGGPAPEPETPGTSVQRDTVPPPPRRAGGLGAPLPGLPPTAQRRTAEPGEPPSPQVQRVPRTTEAPAAGAPAPTAQGGQDVGTESGAHGSQDVTPEPETVAPLLGAAPWTQRATDGPVPQRPTGEAAAGPGSGPAPDAPVQRATQVPALPTAPLLGDRPLPLRTASAPGSAPAGGDAVVQRATGDAGADGGGPGSAPFAPASPSPSPAVAVRWTGTDEGPAPGAPVAPLRRAVSSVQRQVSPASARPDPAPSRGPRVPASVQNAGAVAVAAGVAQRLADGSVVFPSAPRDGTSRPVAQRDPVVQRDSETAEEPPPPPMPDPGPESGPESEPPTAEHPAATTTSTSPDGAPQTPPVTDELVRALYAPLSRLLKADLRLERERSGLLINTRH
ncbi:hypothetical protein [Streptomyces sp. NPDC001665]